MDKSPDDRISILLVEDHKVTLEGFKSWLSETPEFNVIGTASDSDDAVEKAFSLKPDIILLDLHLPGKLGIKETLTHLRELSSRVVIFSAEDRPHLITLVMSLGASAYLSKTESFELISSVLKEVAEGNTGFVSKDLRKKNRFGLTAIETEILGMLAKGMKYDEMAKVRLTSPHTLRNQCDRLQSKLGLNTREALIVWAVENGFGAAASSEGS
jgi:DNA-binding NarL/FixJ family response regulator